MYRVMQRCGVSLTMLLLLCISSSAIARKAKPDAGFTASSTVLFTITKTLPHPANYFTEGLAVCDGSIIESIGLYGNSALIRRQIDDATVLAHYTLPTYMFGEGATCFGEYIYQLTWRERTVAVYDNALKQIRFLHYDGEGWGLTHDADHLIMSNGSATISFRDPHDFRIIRTITVRDGATPIEQLNELEYAQGLLFANIWQQDRIAIIDPADGAVLAWLDLHALADRFDKPERWDSRDNVLNGIAYDAVRDRYFVTGKRWPVMFELRLSGLPTPSAGRHHP